MILLLLRAVEERVFPTRDARGHRLVGDELRRSAARIDLAQFALGIVVIVILLFLGSRLEKFLVRCNHIVYPIGVLHFYLVTGVVITFVSVAVVGVESKALGSFTVIIALVSTTFVGGSGILFDVSASPPLCRNAPITPTRFQGLTKTDSFDTVYRRPGRDSTPVETLDHNCVANFSSYCIGDFIPTPDDPNRLPDSRWLELPQGHGFVSGADVTALSANSHLKYNSQCKSLGGSAQPASPQLCPFKPHAFSGCPQLTSLTNSPHNPKLKPTFKFAGSELVPAEIGLAFVKPAQSRQIAGDRGPVILNVGIRAGYSPSKTSNFTVLTRQFVRADVHRRAWLVAVACLAPGFPAERPNSTGSEPSADIVRLNTTTLFPSELSSTAKLPPFYDASGKPTTLLRRAARRACLPNLG